MAGTLQHKNRGNTFKNGLLPKVHNYWCKQLTVFSSLETSLLNINFLIPKFNSWITSSYILTPKQMTKLTYLAVNFMLPDYKIFSIHLIPTMSVPKSMQRMVTIPNGWGIPTMMNIKNGVISGMLLVSVYAMDFFKLSKIKRPENKIVLSYFYILMPFLMSWKNVSCFKIVTETVHCSQQAGYVRPNKIIRDFSYLPSSTPVTMEAKLSSSRIMSAACLDTSEPAIPIATPDKNKAEYSQQKSTIIIHKYVNYDHPGENSPEKDCLGWLWLTFRQPERKSSSGSSDIPFFTWLWRWLPLRLLKRQSKSSQKVLLRTTLTRMIIIYVLMTWLLGSNHLQ